MAGNAAEELTVAVDVATVTVEAAFTNGRLELPWVAVGDQTFQATLEVTQAQPLEFRLSAASIAEGTSNDPARFQDGRLSIPRVRVGDAVYQAELEMTTAQPALTFRLDQVAVTQ